MPQGISRTLLGIALAGAIAMGTYSQAVARNATYRNVSESDFARELGVSLSELHTVRAMTDRVQLARHDHVAPDRTDVARLIDLGTTSNKLAGEAWRGLMLLTEPQVVDAAIKNAQSNDPQLVFEGMSYLEVYKHPRFKELALRHRGNPSPIVQIIVRDVL